MAIKLTESRLRQIIREESLKLSRSRLPKRRAIKESLYDDGIPSGEGKGSWTYDFGGVGLDTQNGEVAAAMAFIKWRQKKTYSGLRGILASEGLLPRRSKKAMDYPREGLKLSSDWRAESLLDEALLGLVEEIQQETEKEEGNPNIDWGSPSYKKYLEVEINKSVSNWLKEFFRDRESWEDEG